MVDIEAVKAFSALAQEHRLAVFRLLVQEGPNGLPAGEIAKSIGISPSSMSFHLSNLENSGLVHSWRDQRRIIYAANYEITRKLLSFLTEDCCAGRPEICGDLARLSIPCDEDVEG